MLNLVPFAALVNGDGRFLVEKFTFTYLPTGELWTIARSRSPEDLVRAWHGPDFGTMDFPVDGFDVIPLHDDGSEFTAEEVAADITRRLEEAENPVPTTAAPAAGGYRYRVHEMVVPLRNVIWNR